MSSAELVDDRRILVLNSGSSSIKFALYSSRGNQKPHPTLAGRIERIGQKDASLKWKSEDDAENTESFDAPDHPAAVSHLAKWLRETALESHIAAIGHHIVHGGPDHLMPERIDSYLISDLRKIIAFAPEHLPQAIELIESMQKQLASVPQFACFDTAFFADLPPVSRTLPLPQSFSAAGVRRFGFHGISYSYLMEALERDGRPNESAGRVILAHLGNGASMAAVHEEKPLDTTMGFTPAGGLVMSTRTGDIDPGIVSFLMREKKLSPDAFHRLVNHESGMLGISGTSGDVRDLFAAETRGDPHAALALDMFCTSARKWIGALAGSLGGLDTLVFSAGIGEHSPEIRRRICEPLKFLGIRLDPQRNQKNADVISADNERVTVRIIPTDEELMIAMIVAQRMSKESDHG